MKYGDIFKEIIGEESIMMDLHTIEEKAIHKTLFKRYGKQVVSDRGNVFKTKLYDVDKKFDNKLASYKK